MSNQHPYIKNINNFFKWVILCVIVGGLVGTTAAFFLYTLDGATHFRENNQWVVFSLPIAGLLIAILYKQFGANTQKGNNLFIEEHQTAKVKIPFIMAPLVFIGTIITHAAGGSAGREGTAVQMGGAIADQFTKLFKLNQEQRKTILIIGISAGFSAVFGTPLAGAVFALEIMLFKNCKYTDIIPSIATAYIAHYTCLAWNIEHTIYSIAFIPSFTVSNTLWAIGAGILFGLTALLFSYANLFWNNLFKRIKKELIRPVIGGAIIAIFIFLIGSTKYIGLGIPTIIEAFQEPVGQYDFIIKLLITTFTLSAGFKGGEVTPLFFIGATLGNILIWFIPLPMALLAGMGFVAVFAGATHCVIASIVLGIELFGLQGSYFIGVASIAAYFSSGIHGIYSAQLKQGAKYSMYNYIKKVFEL